MSEALFQCERNGFKIRGMEYFAGEKAPGARYPAIIVSHGFSGDYTSEAPYCRALAEYGYVTYSFSFCGGSKTLTPEELKSEGDTTETTVWTEVADLIAVKDYVKALPYIDPRQIILMGCSQGGLISGLAAAKCGAEIYKLVMVFPALCIPDHARRGCLGGASYDPKHVPQVLDCGKILLGKSFHDTVADMDVFLELEAYKGPVLILQGLEDQTVNYSYAIRAKESYAPGQCHLQLMRDTGHAMDEKQRKSTTASIRQFLLEHKEQLTVQVIITHRETQEKEEYRESRIYFTGYCDTACFHGTILPGGCDAQKYYPDGSRSIRADYTLEGIDENGELCHIHIINRDVDGEWKPIIETDSKALAWMERADVTAVLESCKEGPTVRFFFE